MEASNQSWLPADRGKTRAVCTSLFLTKGGMNESDFDAQTNFCHEGSFSKKRSQETKTQIKNFFDPFFYIVLQ